MDHRKHVCPPGAWEVGVGFLVDTLRRQGMTPESHVLDVGCGCLRIGKPLIEFLNPGGYAGVEPCVPILHAGVEHELGHRLVVEKNPVFLYTPVFDFSPLRGPFSHVLASDLFIHCSPAQLSSFLVNLDGVIDAWTKVVITVNVSSAGFIVPKDSPSNTPEEKAAQNRFLYAHADNNTTVYAPGELASLIAREGYLQRTLSEFPVSGGRYVKHVIVLTKA
jgi:hypothetical protein